MRQKILLLDDSVTVQKVVSLSLDKNRYQLLIARNRAEASRFIVDEAPEIILVSDQVSDVEASTFPKEVETWLGRTHNIPPMVLITSENINEAKHYQAVLRKPFTPQTLTALIHIHAEAKANAEPAWAKTKTVVPNFADDFEDQKLQKVFNDTFSEEAKLVDATFQPIEEGIEATVAYDKPSPHKDKKNLWSTEPSKKEQPVPTSETPILSTHDSLAYKAKLESEVENRLEKEDLDEAVDRALAKMLPGIVEKLVSERLDKLLAEQDRAMDIKI